MLKLPGQSHFLSCGFGDDRPFCAQFHDDAVAAAIGRGRLKSLSKATAPLDRLSRREKLLFGAGQIAYGAKLQIMGLVLLFYNQVLGLDAATVSLVISATLIIDAFWDPLFGHLSDHLRTRWGRRHPLIYASALPIGLAFYLLWAPPAGLTGEALAGYLVAVLLFMRLATSFYEMPSRALIPELAPDYHDRTVLLSYRYLWETFGRAAAAFLSFGWFLRETAANPAGQLGAGGYAPMGLVLGVLMTLSILTCAASTHHRISALHAPVPRRIETGQAVREVIATLANWNLGVAVTAGLVAGIAYGVTSGMYVYISTYFWQLPASNIFHLVLVEVIAAPLAALLAPALSRRWGKKHACIALFLLSVVTNNGPILLRLMGWFPGADSELFMPLMLADRVVTGIFGTGGFILVTSMIADIVEESQARTGRRSEGLLLSADGVMRNAVTGVGAAIPGLLITAVAFPVGAAPAEVPRAIVEQLTWIYLPLTSGMSTLSILVWCLYRIGPDQHAANLIAGREATATLEAALDTPIRPATSGSTSRAVDPMSP
jgi:Na+/melibiose symporter-like transporter